MLAQLSDFVVVGLLKGEALRVLLLFVLTEPAAGKQLVCRILVLPIGDGAFNVSPGFIQRQQLLASLDLLLQRRVLLQL